MTPPEPGKPERAKPARTTPAQATPERTTTERATSEPATPASAAGDLVLLATLAVFVTVYCVDAIRASTDILNLILVLPLAVALVALCLVQGAITLRERRGIGSPGPLAEADRKPAVEPAAADAPPPAAVLPIVGIFTAYVLTLPWLGFDVGSCLFLAAFLWMNGERRWIRLAVYSIGFGLLIAAFFSRMLTYPMPMLLLGGT